MPCIRLMASVLPVSMYDDEYFLTSAPEEAHETCRALYFNKEFEKGMV